MNLLCVAITATDLYLGSEDGLVLRRPISELITSAEEQVADVPLAYGLSQNYPNPFNPTTRFRFMLPERSHLSLVVYDILGRQVATLVSARMEAGYHMATWNASSAASGIYFARLVVLDETGIVKYSVVNKLVLLK
jgi:hypothetical protein